MELEWHRIDVSSLTDQGRALNETVDFGIDDTGRIFGEVKHDAPVFLALHLRKVVGRYLDCDLAKIAAQKVHDIVIQDQSNA